METTPAQHLDLFLSNIHKNFPRLQHLSINTGHTFPTEYSFESIAMLRHIKSIDICSDEGVIRVECVTHLREKYGKIRNLSINYVNY